MYSIIRGIPDTNGITSVRGLSSLTLICTGPFLPERARLQASLTMRFTYHALNRYMSAFARMGNVAVMCETLSNLHLPGNPYAIDSVLSIIENNADVCESLRPDVVISIGGALISRKLKEYIRKYPPAHHWTLGDTSPSADCFMAVRILRLFRWKERGYMKAVAFQAYGGMPPFPTNRTFA